MDISTLNEVLGLASNAAVFTTKAASTISTIKGMFEGGKEPDNSEAAQLINDLATELTMANITNLELSRALKGLSQELLRQDQFDKEKGRYDLFETSLGDIVFRLKEDATNGQPVHYVCPVCLNRDRLISFIHGIGDYKICQTDRGHKFQFKNTPFPQVNSRKNRGIY